MKVSRWRLQTQLVVLVIITFLSGQLLSIWLLSDERSLAVQAALGAEAAGRAANVALLLDDAPPYLRQQIVQAANSPLVRFEISSQANVTEREHHEDAVVSARVRALMGDNFSRAIRVEVHEIDQTLLPVPNLTPDMAELHAQMMRGTVSTIELEISIALSGGDWLNVGTRFERPPWQVSAAALTSFIISGGLIVLVILWYVIAKLTRPLTALTRATESFGRGGDIDELPKSGPLEVRRLTQSFDTMRGRLSRFVSDRTLMLAALAHDLRSPLTALRVQSEMVDDQETHAALGRSIAEMSDMIEATLAYASGVGENETTQDVSLRELVQRSAEHCDVTISGGLDITLQVRPLAMGRALRNLIENGARYGKSVTVGWQASSSQVSIWIRDKGPGIPEDKFDQVFEPFVRLEESRSKKTGGTGLGLSITRSVVLLHGGQLSLENLSEGGLEARIVLPL